MRMRLTAGLHPLRRSMNLTRAALHLLICFALASSACAKAGFRGTVLSPDVARKTPLVSSGYHLDDFPVEVDIAALAAAALVPRDTGVVREIASVAGGQDVKERRAIVGVLGVLGGALCHLVLGTTYCWGNFGPYMPVKGQSGEMAKNVTLNLPARKSRPLPSLVEEIREAVARTFEVGKEAEKEEETDVCQQSRISLCQQVTAPGWNLMRIGAETMMSLKKFGGLDASLVLPGAFVAQTLTMPLGSYFQKIIGCRATTALGCGIMAIGVFLSSFAPNLAVFMLCYSFLFGAGVGLAYTAPMVNGWKWFPDKKGLVSGAVVAGFGAGGFVFNQVGTSIINPEGFNAVGGLYPQKVYDNFPVMLRRLSYIYAVMSAIGALAIEPPPSVGVTDGKTPVKAAEGATVAEALKDKKFWMMWFMVVMIATSGINIANNYKKFGGTVEALQSDQFQSLVGSVAALCNGAGRLFWGNMLDMFGFRMMFGVLASIQSATMALYTVLSQSKAGFLFGTGALLFCMGGNFAMFPALTNKVFGGREGAKIYGVLFSAFATASIVGAKLTSRLLEVNWEWDSVFKLMALLSVCATLALPYFKD